MNTHECKTKRLTKVMKRFGALQDIIVIVNVMFEKIKMKILNPCIFIKAKAWTNKKQSSFFFSQQTLYACNPCISTDIEIHLAQND